MEPKLHIQNAANYREVYANSVQIKVSVWDFFFAFGIFSHAENNTNTITNEQGIFMSPQQAKALWNLLGQNLASYEQAFGPVNLETQTQPPVQ